MLPPLSRYALMGSRFSAAPSAKIAVKVYRVRRVRCFFIGWFLPAEGCSDRVRSAALIVTQTIGFVIIDEAFFFRIESNLPTELPANRSCEAGHVAIPDSGGITDGLLTGLDAIKEIADVQGRICAADLVLDFAIKKLGVA